MAGSLVLLALALIFRLLGPAFSMSSRTTVRGELHQRALHAVRVLASDLRNSAADGVVIFPTSPTRTLIGIHPLTDADTEGRRVWSRDYVIHLWENNTLTRLVHTSPIPEFVEHAQRPVRGVIENYLVSPTQSRLLAPAVVNFSVSDADPSANRVEMPFAVSLRVQAEVYGKDEPEQLTVSRSVTPLN